MTLIEFLTLICKSKRFFTYNVTILCGFVTIVLSERAIDRITNFTSNYERVAIKNRNHYENLYKTTLSIFRLFVIIINNLEVFKREFPDFKIISNIFEIEYFQDELFMKLYFDDIITYNFTTREITYHEGYYQLGIKETKLEKILNKIDQEETK